MLHSVQRHGSAVLQAQDFGGAVCRDAEYQATSLPRAHVFYHVFTTSDPRSVDIVRQQLALLTSVRELLSSITCCVSGNYLPHFDESLRLVQQSKIGIHIARAVFNDQTYERLTLRALSSSKISDTAVYLYMHTKGCTKTGEEFVCVQDWRQCIEYFLLEKAAECIAMLATKHFDLVGIMHLAHPKVHFSGNFWWASGEYLLKLIAQHPEIGPQYFDTEMWVGQANPRCHSFFPVTRAHYHQRIYRHEYVMRQ